MRLRHRTLTYEEHQRCAEHLWRVGELAAQVYDIARERCRKAELRTVERLFCTPSQLDIVKSVLDDALFVDLPTHDHHVLCEVYYGVSKRLPAEVYHFRQCNFGRRTPCSDATYDRLWELLQRVRSEAENAWHLAIQRLPVAHVSRLERLWRTGGTVDAIGMLFERKRAEDARRGTCSVRLWPPAASPLLQE